MLTDVLNFNTKILDFAAYISKLGKSKLVGVFVENPIWEMMIPTISALDGAPYIEDLTPAIEEQKRQAEQARKNMELFKSGCAERGLAAYSHYDKGSPLDQVIEESRYADLIIADPSFSFSADEKAPSAFILELLNKAECPVLIAPEQFEEIDEIVLAFDGSRSSAFAIKQFCYQLPKLADKRLIVLHINETDKKSTEDHTHFREWLTMHFPNITFLDLSGEPREVLFEYFMSHTEQRKQLLVTGAFGRSYLSTFFKPGAAELVLKSVDIPIFVTHH